MYFKAVHAYYLSSLKWLLAMKLLLRLLKVLRQVVILYTSNNKFSIYKAIQITWCSKRARLRRGRFLPNDCKIPASFPVTEAWSAILKGKHKYHVRLDKLHRSTKILSHDNVCFWCIFGRWIQICFQNFSITHTFRVAWDYVKVQACICKSLRACRK